MSTTATARIPVDTGELVVKSNKLVEASYRLSLAEQQLILFAICQAREQQVGLSKKSYVSVEALAFARQFNLSPTNVYELLSDAATRLFDRKIIFTDTHPKSGKPRITKVRWVSEISYIEGAGTVEFSFSPKVVPLITRLETAFTSYRLTCIANLSSLHAVRIYELLVQYLGIGTRKFELQEIKKILGIAPDEYKIINDFKKRVIDVAVTQINQHTDLKISYLQQKTGRTVTGFTFLVHSKSADKTVIKKPKKPVQLALAGVDVVSVTSRKPKTTDVADANDDGF
jgi:plasmid replication initiation protein